MNIIGYIVKIIKGKKKMKTLVEVPKTNFIESNVIVTDQDELKLTGLDGNNVAYDQTIQVNPNIVVFFDNSNRNFVTMTVNGEVSDNMLLYKVIRTLA